MAQNTNKEPAAKQRTKPTTVWQQAQQPHGALWIVLFFIGAMIVTWLITGCQWQQQWQHMAGTYERITTGGTSATTSREDTGSDQYTRVLDGIRVDAADKAALWPYAIMIENLRSVRPQSGLSSASVVYEALVEGGATRFMAVFDPSVEIEQIMPVRSARPYYLEWVSEYDALYAHAGGSPKALTVIRENSIKDLEALSSDAKYFWRDTSKYAPHNLVTSSEKINYALRDHELLDVPAVIDTWTFKDEAALADRGENGREVEFNFSGGSTYRVNYIYDRQQNHYARFNAGEPHVDARTGNQISVKNVIVQLTEAPVYEGGKGRLDIYVGGIGDAWVFRDGMAIQATWQKNSRTDRTRFYDSDGKEIALNRGTTWVHILTKTQDVLYK